MIERNVMIKNKTIYTKEKFLNFQKYHYFHQIKIIRIIFSLFGIFFLILSILGFTWKDYIFSFIELFFGLFLLIEFNTPIIPILQANIILKSDSMIIGMENTFVFYDQYIEVVNSRSTSKIPYEEIYCYKENKDFFYIYLNKMSALLVEKEGITEGSLEELSKLLQQKINDKKNKKNLMK